MNAAGRAGEQGFYKIPKFCFVSIPPPYFPYLYYTPPSDGILKAFLHSSFPLFGLPSSQTRTRTGDYLTHIEKEGRGKKKKRGGVYPTKTDSPDRKPRPGQIQDNEMNDNDNPRFFPFSFSLFLFLFPCPSPFFSSLVCFVRARPLYVFF